MAGHTRARFGLNPRVSHNQTLTDRLIKGHINSLFTGSADLSIAPTKINVHILSEFRQVAEQEISLINDLTSSQMGDLAAEECQLR